MNPPTHVRYTPDGPIKRAILTIYGTSPKEALANTRDRGSCLKDKLPAESVVKTPQYRGFDPVKCRYFYELPIFLGPDVATAQEVIERCIQGE